ncbi:MAG: hypothetical protein NTZ48_05085, partial [Candidatus Omnitrophica bacterium]|nr:hypothetical protein [Candidatus Omnitrophota bacterium]
MKTRIVKGIVLFLVGVGLLIPNPAHARRMKIANYKDARPISDLSVEYLLRTLELEGFSCIAFVRNVLSIAEAVKCESYDIYNAMNIKMVGDFISSPFSETVLSEKDWGSVLSLLTDVKGFDKTREYPYELYKAQIDKREDFFLSEREKINFLDFLQGEAIGGAFDYAGLIQAPREEREMVKGVENDVEQSEWILLSDIIGEHNARLVIYKLKNSAEVNITQALPLVRQLSEKSFLKLNDKVSLRYRTYLLTDTRYFVDIIDELIYQSETSKIDFCSTVEEINRYLDVYSGIRLIHGRQRFNAGKAVILPCLQKFKANPQDISEAIRFIGSICNDLSNRNTKDFPSYDFFISSFIDYVVPQAIKNCADLVDLKVKLERTKNLFNLFADSGCYDFAFGFSEFGKFDSMGEILFAKNTDDFNKYVDIIEKTFIAVGELFPVRESDAPINKYTQSILPYLICKFLEPVLFQQAIDSFINCITRLNKEIPGQSGVMFNLFFEKFMPRLLNMPIESSEFSSF